MVNQMLMSIMICRIVKLSVIYGVSKESSFAFATYGFLISKYVGIDEACEYGRIALSLLDRFNAKDVLARVTCVLNDFFNLQGTTSISSTVVAERVRNRTSDGRY